jgi:hypothetical protein
LVKKVKTANQLLLPNYPKLPEHCPTGLPNRMGWAKYNCIRWWVKGSSEICMHDETDISVACNCQVFLFGAIAKLGATVATYPLLVVKVSVLEV